MSGDSESIIGEIPVVARLAIGIERLILFVTSVRMIVAHVGKRGAGALVTSAIFGRLSGGFEDVMKSRNESRSGRALQRLTPERILDADRDNFQLGFEEIVSVRLVETPVSVEMTVLTRDDKLDFRATLPLEGIVRLLETCLGSKLSVERLPVDMSSGRQRHSSFPLRP